MTTVLDVANRQMSTDIENLEFLELEERKEVIKEISILNEVKKTELSKKDDKITKREFVDISLKIGEKCLSALLGILLVKKLLRFESDGIVGSFTARTVLSNLLRFR